MLVKNSNMTGIVLMCSAMAFITMNDILVKFFSDTLTIPQILLLRGLFVSALSILWVCTLNLANALKQLINPLVLARSALEAASAITYFTALSHMPIAELCSIFLMTPLLVVTGAAIIYREKISYLGGMAIIAGFTGVLLIVKPGTADFSSYALVALAAAAFAASRDLLTRKIKHNVSSVVICCSGGIGNMLIGLTLTILAWNNAPLSAPVLSSAALWLGMLAAAVVITIGNYQIILAFRHSDASVVAPFRYTTLLWAMLGGFLIWHTIPDTLSLLGSGLIIGAGLYFMGREWKISKRPALQAGFLET